MPRIRAGLINAALIVMFTMLLWLVLGAPANAQEAEEGDIRRP